MFKKYFWVIFLVFLFFPYTESILDYFIGDNDGTITKWGLHDKIIWIHILGVAISLGIWAWLSKNFLLANLAATVGLWFILEIIFSFLLPSPQATLIETGNYGDIFKKDSLIGYQLTPLAQGKALKVTKDYKDTIYNVTYDIDAHSRRNTPNNQDSLDQYALFFGGSFTFGEGLHGNQTIPSLFTKYTQKYNAYNYGMSGCGPHQMLAFLENNLVQPTIAEKEGMCIYVFIDDHVRRMNGSISLMFSFGDTHPRYEIIDNKIVRTGTHKTGHPKLLKHLFEVASKSNVLKYFGMLEKPLTLRDPLENTAKLIKAAETLYQQQFKNNNFYIALYPGGDNAIVPYLEKEKLKFIDLSDLFSATDYRLHPEDRHPTLEGNDLMVKALVAKLPKEIID